jgi:hypothetical protein
MSNSDLSPLGPSKCSSRSQSTVSLLAAGLEMFLVALKKSRNSLIDLSRSKKCSKLSLGPAPLSNLDRRRGPVEVDEEDPAVLASFAHVMLKLRVTEDCGTVFGGLTLVKHRISILDDCKMIAKGEKKCR